MLPTPPDRPEDLIPFITAAGETPNVDAKGPMTWDGGEASASLAKDVMAFANCRDGGVIVIGKSENPKGTFILEGVAKEQAASFETTNVATWINNRCQPPVHVTCNQVELNGKLFLVLRVREFDDVPVICTKDYGDAKKMSLRAGTLYVRTANVESAPLQTIEQLRSLIGLATLKKGDQLLKMFQAMLQGQPLLPPCLLVYPTTKNLLPSMPCSVLKLANPLRQEVGSVFSILNVTWQIVGQMTS